MNFRHKTKIRGCQYISTIHYKRFPLGNNILDWKIGQREKRKRTGTVWSVERKSAHSEEWDQIMYDEINFLVW